MADNYLEKRYEAVFGAGKPKVKRVGHPLDDLLLRNRSTRGYNKEFVVTRDMLMRIVTVATRIPSARNQQALRFRLVTRDSGAQTVLEHVKMGAALPELHMPLPGTEPEAFIVICSDAAENRMLDVDLGIAAQSMLLKAVEMGLNGLIIGAFNGPAIQQGLQLPSQPLLILAIGKGIEHFELRPIAADEDHKYYRENGVHIVPKVRIDDLLV